MDVARAKYFLFNPNGGRKAYITRDLQSILDLNDNSLIRVYAVIETEEGEVLCDMDFAYSGSPIIMGRFMHLDSFKRFRDLKIEKL